MQTAIVCRTVAPLIRCAFDLIARNVPVVVLGKDVGQKLKEKIGEILQYRRNCPIEEFLELLYDWIVEIREQYYGLEGKEAYVAECEDVTRCLSTMSQRAKTAKGLFDIIDEYFVDEEKVEELKHAVVLCTVHASKGFEWDRVVVLRPDLMPHPNAELEQDLAQEENLRYISETRPIQELLICHDAQPD